MDKTQLLSVLKKKPVPVEVGGVTLYVKPLTVAERERFALWRKDNPTGAGVVGRLIAASLCNESGALVLDNPDDAADLDGALCDALCERILDINGMKAPEPGKGSAPSGPN